MMYGCMRTTLTLDSDVAVRLRKLQDGRDLSWKEAVNTALRRGLDALDRPAEDRPPYRMRPVDLGEARMPLDSVADALALGEGEGWR